MHGQKCQSQYLLLAPETILGQRDVCIVEGQQLGTPGLLACKVDKGRTLLDLKVCRDLGSIFLRSLRFTAAGHRLHLFCACFCVPDGFWETLSKGLACFIGRLARGAQRKKVSFYFLRAMPPAAFYANMASMGALRLLLETGRRGAAAASSTVLNMLIRSSFSLETHRRDRSLWNS